MRTQPLDELYFQWLYRQVADPDLKDPSLTYWKLLKEFFAKEFLWNVPNDENRAEDGKELRSEFIHEERLTRVDSGWLNVGCSMLELMVGLSRHLSFEADGEPYYWFWKMVDNLGLSGYSDNRRLPKQKVEEILDRVIFRTYKRNGLGGLFPLKKTNKDQRKVELWYQKAEYLLQEQSE